MLKNLFESLPSISSKDEDFITLLENKSIKIERIVSSGQSSEDDFWYEQTQNEWVIVLEGDAILSFEDGDLIMKKGDFINIPAYKKHRVKSTKKNSHTIWLAIFYN
ncbi:cupin domain-containing protein [Arcobacter sp. FWKO B]|uniref:cupin domain-containing protein n=1 Tax=Arcobacter sp. FWKO B TaxID=2593672 RepID=UPI0018A59480|nr:cupin domain-containing protein [Arcobacter sp. FWKO B]QOG11584.1 cupin domain-containing protein [Arcobacter sp. FWKO B]